MIETKRDAMQFLEPWLAALGREVIDARDTRPIGRGLVGPGRWGCGGPVRVETLLWNDWIREAHD